MFLEDLGWEEGVSWGGEEGGGEGERRRRLTDLAIFEERGFGSWGWCCSCNCS